MNKKLFTEIISISLTDKLTQIEIINKKKKVSNTWNEWIVMKNKEIVCVPQTSSFTSSLAVSPMCFLFSCKEFVWLTIFHIVLFLFCFFLRFTLGSYWIERRWLVASHRDRNYLQPAPVFVFKHTLCTNAITKIYRIFFRIIEYRKCIVTNNS